MRLILPSVTTLGSTTSSWRDKIAEIEPLGLKEIGLFLTGLTTEERIECYAMLREVHRYHEFTIPFVHAVAAMSEEEYRFLIDGFGAEVFNLHPLSEFPLEHALSDELRSKIYIENSHSDHALTQADIDGFAGICLDVSHLEETRLNDIKAYREMELMLATNKIGANHISAVWYKTTMIGAGKRRYSQHIVRTSRDLTYLKGYSENFFAKFCALELENSLAEQVKLIPVVEQLLNDTRPYIYIKTAA